METYLYVCVATTISSFLVCSHAAASLQEQLDHVANRVLESRLGRRSALPSQLPSRRAEFSFDVHNSGGIVGAPSRPSHLPEAEPILPGHTLIRPAMGMLKSSIKFPHRELENGFGVLGNINNLGIRWDGKNERVLYSGFRRMPSDYIMVVPKMSSSKKPSFDISSIVLDVDKKRKVRKTLLKKLKHMKMPAKKKLILYLVDIPEEHFTKTDWKSRSRIKNRGNELNKNIHTYRRNLQKSGKNKDQSVNNFKLGMNRRNYRSDMESRRQVDSKSERSGDVGRDSDSDHVSMDTEPYGFYNSHQTVDIDSDDGPVTAASKQEWLQGTKFQFDNIKIDENAVSIETFALKEQGPPKREWSFFNRHDWQDYENQHEH